MDNITNYKGKKGVRVPKDIKEYILKRVKEGSKTLKEVADEHGVSKQTLKQWIKSETGNVSDSNLLKLQKENQILKQLVAELLLKIRESEKRGW